VQHCRQMLVILATSILSIEEEFKHLELLKSHCLLLLLLLWLGWLVLTTAL